MKTEQTKLKHLKHPTFEIMVSRESSWHRQVTPTASRLACRCKSLPGLRHLRGNKFIQKVNPKTLNILEMSLEMNGMHSEIPHVWESDLKSLTGMTLGPWAEFVQHSSSFVTT